MRFAVLVVALVLGCSSEGANARAGAADCPGVEVLVAAASNDFQSSVVCGMPGACASGADLGGDPVLSSTGDRAFFVSRDNDFVFELDPSCGTPSRGRISVNALAPSKAAGVRIPANPHDVAAAPDGTLVVPLYNAARIAFIKDGRLEATSIDLAPYDDADGNPQADAVRVVDVGGAAKAFVTLERLDDRDKLRSTRTSQMLRIDVATRTPEATIDLEGRNPFNRMVELGSDLFIAAPGNFDDATEERAGIERFDTKTSTSRLLVREQDLGGSVSEVAVSPGCAAAIVAGPQKDVNPTFVVTFDPTSGRVIMGAASPALGPTAGYDLWGMAWRGRTLYVGDRRRGPNGYAVHVLERSDDCRLADTGRTIPLDRAPVALRAAQPIQGR